MSAHGNDEHSRTSIWSLPSLWQLVTKEEAALAVTADSVKLTAKLCFTEKSVRHPRPLDQRQTPQCYRGSQMSLLFYIVLKVVFLHFLFTQVRVCPSQVADGVEN